LEEEEEEQEEEEEEEEEEEAEEWVGGVTLVLDHSKVLSKASYKWYNVVRHKSRIRSWKMVSAAAANTRD